MFLFVSFWYSGRLSPGKPELSSPPLSRSFDLGSHFARPRHLPLQALDRVERIDRFGRIPDFKRKPRRAADSDVNVTPAATPAPAAIPATAPPATAAGRASADGPTVMLPPAIVIEPLFARHFSTTERHGSDADAHAAAPSLMPDAAHRGTAVSMLRQRRGRTHGLSDEFSSVDRVSGGPRRHRSTSLPPVFVGAPPSRSTPFPSADSTGAPSPAAIAAAAAAAAATVASEGSDTSQVNLHID